jgi:hypothetical protein
MHFPFFVFKISLTDCSSSVHIAIAPCTHAGGPTCEQAPPRVVLAAAATAAAATIAAAAAAAAIVDLMWHVVIDTRCT